MQQLQIELKIDTIEIKQLPVEEGVRSLGIWINPENQQNSQFKIMVDRMKTVIAKLEQTQMLIQLEYIYYNAYIIKAVYFGYRIIQLTPN